MQKNSKKNFKLERYIEYRSSTFTLPLECSGERWSKYILPEKNNSHDEVSFMCCCSSSPIPLCFPRSHAKVHSLQIFRAHKVHLFPFMLKMLTRNQRGIESSGREAPSVSHCFSPRTAQNIIPNSKPASWGVTGDVQRSASKYLNLLAVIYFVSLKEMFVKQLLSF